MAGIAVFVDDIERFSTLRYLIQFMIAEWRRAGMTVRICTGTRRPAKADLSILDIDSTRLSPDQLALAASHPAVINLDIHYRLGPDDLAKPTRANAWWRSPAVSSA
ncbi:MAG: hypothetical protein HGA75_10785 [Thiobacillus sp.]|nr:hypothetical protein [Thiobacillus sp.]